MSTLTKLFDNFFMEYLTLNPIMATFIGINDYNHLYPNYLSEKEISRQKDFYTKYLKLANNFKTQNLSKKQSHHLEVFIYRINNELEGFKYPLELLPLDQFNNFILDFADMASGMSFLPLKNIKDFKNLILKTKDFLEVIDTAICRMREGISKKMVFSKIVMEKVVEQLDDLIKSKSYLVEKIPKSIKKEYLEILDTKLTLKIKELIIFLKKEYIPKR